jgi:hypothetical protein
MVYTCKGCPADYSFFKTNNYGEAEAAIQAQGVINNCSFIASLISVSWVTGLPVPRPKGFDATEKYSIQFWDAPNQPYVPDFWVSEKFWMDENNNFKYARSSEAGELWPAVYEKAYANFIQPNKNGDIDDMAAIQWPAPDKPALVTLIGWNTRPNVTTTGKSGDVIYGEIAPKCTGKKTTRPMVAWTKAAGVPVDAQLKPNHTYSILGVFSSGNPAVKYIVLRNPLGKMAGATTPGALVGGNWAAVNDSWYDANSIQIGGRGTRNIPFNADIGLFALPANNFQQYFAAYTWVGPA